MKKWVKAVAILNAAVLLFDAVPTNAFESNDISLEEEVMEDTSVFSDTTDVNTEDDYDVFYNTVYDPEISVSEEADSSIGSVDNSECLIEDPDIVEDNSEEVNTTCGQDLSWKFINMDTLVISGTGAMYDYTNEYSAPWSNIRDLIHVLVITEGVTSIGENAFLGCNAMERIEFPLSLKQVGDNAFYGCNSLSEEAKAQILELSDNVAVKTTVSNDAASETNAEAETVYDATEVETAETETEEMNPEITEMAVEVEKTETTEMATEMMETEAIEETTDVEETIPTEMSSENIKPEEEADLQVDTMEEAMEEPALPSETTETETETEMELLEEALEVSQELEEMKAAGGNNCGENGADVTFSIKDGILTVSGSGAIKAYSSPADAPWYNLRSTIKKIVIEDGINGIGKTAFYNLTNLTEIDIAPSVIDIGVGAFADCYSLTKINGMNGVKSIQSYAFQKTKVSSFTLPVSVASFDPLAFFGCDKLTSFQVATGNANFSAYDGVIYADGGKTVLSCPVGRTGSISVRNGATKIGSYAFMDTKISSVNIPSSVTEIGNYVFARSSITSLTIPASVSKLGYGCVNASETISSLYIHATIEELPYETAYQAQNLRTVVITSPITRIDNLAFYQCKSLVSVTLPDTLQTIGVNSFGSCTSLISVRLPESLKVIAYKAFSGDVSLTTINIPDGIEDIYSLAFEGCTNLSWSAPASLTEVSDGVYIKTVSYSQYAYEDYTKAFEVLSLVNQARADAGLAPLKMDYSLLQSAMLRANEISIYFDHTRPCGLDCMTANSKMSGENIAAGLSTATDTINQWMNSSGHRANILRSSFKSIGIGCVKTDGGYYWVQCFSYDDASEEVFKDTFKDEQKYSNIFLKADGSSLHLTSRIYDLYAGKTSEIKVYNDTDGWFQYMNPEMFEFSSSDPSIASIEGNKITAYKAGNVSISATLKGCPNSKVSQTYTVERQPGHLVLEKTYYSQYGAETNQTLKLSAYSEGGQPLCWKSDSSWASVDSNGLVTVKGGSAGIATITVQAAQTDVYNSTSKTIKLYIYKLINEISGDYYTYKTLPAGVQSFKLPYTAKGGAKLSYFTNTKGVEIAADGTMTISSDTAGYIDVTVAAKETALYYSTTRTMYLHIKRTIANDENLDKSITLSATAISLSTGKSQIVKVLNLTAGDRIISWKSANTAIATVDSNGLITGKKAGTTTVTVTLQSGLTASVSVVVNASDDEAITDGNEPNYTISLNTTAVTLSAGQSKKVEVVVWAVGDKVASWKSANTAIAEVNENGLITAKKAGSTTVTVTMQSGVTDNVKVTVNASNDITGKSIALSTTSVRLDAGKSQTVKVLNLAAGDKIVSWKSANTTIATVNSHGLITGRKAGTTNVTVSLQSGRTAKVSVTVNVPRITITAIYNSVHGGDIRWKPIAGVDSYVIYRYGFDGKGFVNKVIGRVDAKKSSFIDTSIKNNRWGRVYNYSIVGVVNNKEISSTKSKGFILQRIAPMKITKVKNTSSGTIRVSWALDAGENKAYGYEIQYAESSADLNNRTGTFKKLTVEGRKSLSSNISGLRKGKTYYFRVRAYVIFTSSIGTKTKTWSQYSKVVSAKVRK